MNNYKEKFKDPRWQKKRLEIFERDNFTCQSCGDKNETLHVHHRYYEKGKEPWEYDNEVLITLCEGCHKIEGMERKEEEENLLFWMKRIFLSSDIQSLADIFPSIISSFEDSDLKSELPPTEEYLCKSQYFFNLMQAIERILSLQEGRSFILLLDKMFIDYHLHHNCNWKEHNLIHKMKDLLLKIQEEEIK